MPPTEVEAIVDLAAKTPTETVEAENRTFIAIHKDYALREVTDPHDLKPKPSHIVAAVDITTAAGMVAYLNRFKGPSTLLFAHVNRREIIGIVDYHEESTGVAVEAEPAAANYSAHRASLTLQHSEEWAAWKGLAATGPTDQLTFARFLEEHMEDIVKPAGADILEACRTLQVTRNVLFKSAVRTASGMESFGFVEETTGGAGKDGKAEIPPKFTLSMPVYYGGILFSVDAYLRWTLTQDKKLRLGIQLKGAQAVEQEAFKDIVDAIITATNVDVIDGAPPAL